MNSTIVLTAIKKGSVLLDQGRYPEACAVFHDGLSENPRNARLLNLLAYCQYHIPKQLTQALKTVEQAIACEVDNPNHYELKAMILADLKRLPEAHQMVDEALKLDTFSAQGYTIKAYVFIKQERWTEAEDAAREALNIDAEHRFANNMLATALNMQNKLNESVRLASTMLSRDPDDYASHSSAGWVYLNKGNHKRAQIHFQEALRLNPNFEPARAGMLETFKSRSMFYQWYLKYAFFMTRRTQKSRWLIIIGIYLVFRLIGKSAAALFDGPYAFLGYLLIFSLYLIFFWTWISRGLGNFIVFTDKFARHALNKMEKLDAVFVGGLFTFGLLGFAASIIFNLDHLRLVFIALIFSTIPFAVTFLNQRPAGRRFYGTIGSVIVFSGIFAAFVESFQIDPLLKFAHLSLGTALLLFIAATWLGAFGFLNE